jgi:hypothetical protein
VVLAPARLQSDLTDSVMIAWDESPECWHAVSAAIPFMHLAKSVRVISVDQDASNRQASHWLLQSQDLIGSDTFSLTQEFLSHMLGVRRNTVSVEAHAVQEAGLIRYRRGNVTILNRDGLEDCACECYSVIREETDKLMGPAKTPSQPGA